MEHNLPLPKNQTQEIVYELITHDKINRREMFNSTGILNLTARIADLRNKYYVPIICTEIMIINKFGRKISYGEWSIADKQSASIIYLNLQSQNIR